MAQSRRTVRTLLPKQTCVKRKSVSSDSSTKWIDSCIESDIITHPPVRRRVSSSTECKRLLPLYANYMTELDVSSASSPEPDYFTGTNHEFMAIESADVENTPVETTDPQICDLPSVPSSQNTVDQPDLIYELSQDRESNHTGFPHARDGSEFDYLELLHRDTLTSPYLNLTQKTSRDRARKDSLVHRLNLLKRRSFSDRSIWLHQRTLNKASAPSDRLFRVFRVVECCPSQRVGLPGLVPFRAIELHLPEQEATEKQSDFHSGVILLLPVSGQRDQESTGSILGDTVHVNNLLRIFSPWSVLAGHKKQDFPTLFQFFWVERVRPHDLHDWIESSVCSNLSIHPTAAEAIQLDCSCLTCGTRSAINTCSKRFRIAYESDDELDDAGPNKSEAVSLDQLRNPILVLGVHRFWLANKLRDILLIVHHSSGHGLVILPLSQKPSNKFISGSLYATEGLLQVPGSQVSDGLQRVIEARITDIQRRLYVDSLEKFAQFCSKLRSIPESSTSSLGPFCLWDARVSTFQLVKPNYFVAAEPVPFHEELPPFTRCRIEGTFLSEIPEGSLIKADELHTIKQLGKSFFHAAAGNTKETFYDLSHVTRVMYLLVPAAARPHIVPCLCLPNVLSALNYLHDIEPRSTCILSSSVLWTCPISIDNAVIGSGFVFIDQFTTIRITNGGTCGRPVRIERGVKPDYVKVNSAEQLRHLHPHTFIRFSGIINRVSTSRSHTWPLCNHCYSSDLAPVGGGTELSQVNPSVSLRCNRCTTRLGEDAIQLFELEVCVQLETEQSRGLTDPFQAASDRPQLHLNMSPKRMFKLMGLTGNEFPKDMQFNPRSLLYKRVDDARGLIIRLEQNVPVTGRAISFNRILVLELD